MRETMISLSYKIGAGGEEAASSFSLSLLPCLKIQPALRVAGTPWNSLPSSFQGAAAGGTTAPWPPSMRGGSPGGHVQVCLCAAQRLK